MSVGTISEQDPQVDYAGTTYAALMIVVTAGPGRAENCLRPVTPLPSYPEDDAETREIIKEDFYRYFNELQEYFNCLHRARQEAFNEAHQVNQD